MSKSNMDILVKLIRVVANLSINDEAGVNLADNKKCVEYLLHILGETVIQNDRK